MNINSKLLQRQKLLFQFILISILIVVITTVFRDELYREFGSENYTSIHLIMEIFIVFFSLAIAVQIWLGTKYKPDRKAILLGNMFFGVGILEIFHTLSYSGMPYFLVDQDPNLSLWFSTIPRLILPIGLIIIYSLKEKKVNKSYMNITFIVACIICTLTISLLFNASSPMPKLFSVNGDPTTVRNNLQIVSIIIEVVAIFVMVKLRKRIKHRANLIIAALVYLILSDVMYLRYDQFVDIYIFLAHVFHLLAYALLFFAIYYVQVRLPFIEMTKAHMSLAKSEMKIKQMAYYDEQTGLPNEQFFKVYLKEHLERNMYQKALITFGINRYAILKASIGREQAQQLINMVSERISIELNGQFPLFKLEEERFVIFIEKYVNPEQLQQLAEQLQQAMMSQPFIMKHFSLTSRIHMGVSTYPNDTTTCENLIEFAVFAMYEARKKRQTIVFYTSEMQKARENRIMLEHDLASAIIDGQLFLEYQPQMDLNTGEISSMEALIRWWHPERGLISPFEFIPIAEESGLIIPIGQWVLETACRETMELQKKIEKNIGIAVNLSMSQLYKEDLVQVVQSVLCNTGLQPENLQLEITESMTVNTRQIIPVLHDLKNLGVTIAVDDFGTGYSSLSYLKDFPLDVLKIDRSFIRNILENEKDDALVKMILSMAKHLQLKVVAEGIETVEQLHYLLRHHCDKIQGYYISKPISIAKFEESFDIIETFAQENLDEATIGAGH